MGRLTKQINGIWDADRDSGYNSLDCAEKLAHYEDLEEQGRLIELPCALNTKVYFIGKRSDGSYVMFPKTLFTYDECIRHGKGIGEWLYATKEEAEAKLKELENE